MKYVCEQCERLVDAGGYRVEGGALLLRCPRCEGDSRVADAPGASNEPAEQPAPQRMEHVQSEGRPVVVPFAVRPAAVQLVAAPEPPEVVPAGERCPKCASAKNGRAACAKCGLVFELYKPELDIIPQSARRDFARLLEQQGTPDSDRGLDAVTPPQVANMARLARHHLADYPDDARAIAILDKLTARSLALAAAAAQSESMARSGEPSRKALVIVVAGLAIVSLLALLTVLVRSA